MNLLFRQLIIVTTLPMVSLGKSLEEVLRQVVHSMNGSFHGMRLVANTGPTAAFGNKLDGNWTYSG